MAAVRWKEVMLLGADSDVKDRPDSRVVQLRPVGRGQVEQKPIARTLAHEPRIELRGHLGSHFIAAPTDARTDAGLDAAAAELALHELHGGRRDAGPGSAPPAVREARSLPLPAPPHTLGTIG